MLDRVLRAEDLRGRGADSLGVLIAALASPDSGIRRVATRGLGRQERFDLIGALFPLLHDSVVAVREEAANALAQSLRAPLPRGDSSRANELSLATTAVFAALRDAAMTEHNPEVAGVFARSIGRLPYSTPAPARDAEEAIATVVGRASASSRENASSFPPALMTGAVHGLYNLALSRRTLGALTGPSIAILRRAVLFGRDSTFVGSPQDSAAWAGIRRLAWLALSATGHRDELLVRMGARDPDAQVRRLAAVYLPNISDRFLQQEVLQSVVADPSPLVRIEWVRQYRQLVAVQSCAPLLQALRDDNPHVRLAAIDALGEPCPDRAVVVAALRELASPPDAAGMREWHAPAHALAALARVDTAAARPALAGTASNPVWQIRLYAARGATAMRDTALLARLAADSAPNVREAAIDGLSATAGRAGDATYRAALSSRDAPVVLAAARALRGASPSDSLIATLLNALDRFTALRRETSRDVRRELLARVGELGTASSDARLSRYVRDFDPDIAARAAGILSTWRGKPVTAAPDPSAGRHDAGLGRVALGPPPRLRVTMAGPGRGASFVLRLDPSLAPATVARVVALARAGYYNGLTWHRVVADFVVQGGSPGANEYVGDGPFMRDELGLASHLRGTVGISTRGRDTGDAQLFINLVDNYRLDHEYTVFGEVESGMDVVDAVLEGDVMARVEVLPAREPGASRGGSAGFGPLRLHEPR